MPRSRGIVGRLAEAERLRAVRRRLQLTQRELAEQLRVAPSAIAQWESGKHTLPGPVLELLQLYEAELEDTNAPSSLSRTLLSLGAGALPLVCFGLPAEEGESPLRRHLRSTALRKYVEIAGRLKG